MSSGTLTVEQSDGIVRVRLDRPHVHNALSSAVLAELDSVLGEVASSDARVVVLTGAGTRAFSAGADLDELVGLDAQAAHELLSAGQAVLARLEACPVPVIAAVNGLALGGGCELALACTFMVLAESAELGLPETRLGLIPGYGGTQRLARLVGRPVAAHAILTGERITAERAHALGLTPVPPVPADRMVEVVDSIAHRIASRGPRAVRSALLALRHGSDAGLGAGLALESALAGLVTGGAEADEGIAAFRERRSPSFDHTGENRGAP